MTVSMRIALSSMVALLTRPCSTAAYSAGPKYVLPGISWSRPASAEGTVEWTPPLHVQMGDTSVRGRSSGRGRPEREGRSKGEEKVRRNKGGK